MRKLLNVRLGMLFGLALIGAMFVVALQSAEARPRYYKVFVEKYPKVTEAKKLKCNVCHVGKKKKDRNVYGKAMAETIVKKNEKDPDVITESLVKVEKMDSPVDGKTFGELLEKGQLPASK